MSKAAVVPIHLDALVVDVVEEVVGPTLDIARAPWFGRGKDGVLRDQFSQNANVAPAVRRDPLTPNGLYLAPGVHLHWALPDALTRGTTAPPDGGFYVAHDGLWFPRVPDRWLVLRRTGGQTRAAWLVESDFVHPDGDVHPEGEGANAVEWPLSVTSRSLRPYIRVGRRTRLIPGAPPPGNGRRLANVDRPLTALGPGEPTFAALYPACHSIFGLHDDAGAKGRVSYEVVGWYADTTLSPLSASRALPDATAATLARILSTARDKPISPAEIGDTAAAGAEAAEILFRARSRWTQPDGTDWAFADCDGLVFFGSVEIDPGRPGTDPGPVSAPVAVGTCAPGAMATLLAHRVGAPSLETELEAVGLGASLADHPLDFTAKLAELRHRAGFVPTGHTRVWSIGRRGEAVRDPLIPQPPPDVDPVLPPALAHALNALNLAQEAHDRALDALESRRQRLFADWQSYMLSTYPADDDADFALDGDVLRDDVTIRALDDVEHALTEAQTLSETRDARLAETQALLDAGNASAAPGDGLALHATATQRYWQPRDPVVAIDRAGALAATRRHGRDGRARPDNRLECVLADIPAMPGLASSLTDLGPFRAAVTANATPAFDAIARHAQGRGGWNALLLEWAAAVTPIGQGNDQRARMERYDSDFIDRIYRLSEDRCDFDPAPGADLSPSGPAYVVSGRALLTGDAGGILARQIVEHIEAEQAAHRAPPAGLPRRGPRWRPTAPPRMRAWRPASPVSRP